MAKTTVDYIRELGGQIIKDGRYAGQPARRALAAALWNAALKEDPRATKFILDYDVEVESPLVIEAKLLEQIEKVYGQHGKVPDTSEGGGQSEGTDS